MFKSCKDWSKISSVINISLFIHLKRFFILYTNNLTSPKYCYILHFMCYTHNYKTINIYRKLLNGLNTAICGNVDIFWQHHLCLNQNVIMIYTSSSSNDVHIIIQIWSEIFCMWLLGNTCKLQIKHYVFCRINFLGVFLYKKYICIFGIL